MKALICFYFLLTSFIFLSSCKKKEISCDPILRDISNMDTIYPSEYLATYPGSWWEYDNGRRDECSGWVDQIVFRDGGNNSDGCETALGELVVVPKFNNWLIYDNSRFNSNNTSYTTDWNRIVGELGESWESSNSFGEGTSSGHTWHKWKVDSLLETKEVNGTIYEDVLLLSYYTSEYYDHIWGGPPAKERRYYYAKNIGLIKYLYIWEYAGEEETFELMDYFIAPH